MDKISTITLPDGTKYRLSDNDAQLIKDTVGWTGKNLLKNYGVNTTKSGITMTVNADKSVTVNGTISQDSINFDIFCLADLPDGEFILSGIEGGSNTTYELSLWTRAQSGSGSVSVRIGSPSGRPARLYDDSNPIVFDKNKLYRNSDSTLIDPSNIFVNVIVSTNVSNITFYPMIRRADITDPTYEPYHESVEEEIEQIYADNGVLGAKNLLLNNATSQTINGVTVTVDDNKVITLNGTSTADSYIVIFATSDLNSVLAKYGDLILNGSHPTEYTKARMITRYGTSNYVIDSGKGVLLSSAIAYDIGIMLQIYKNNTFTNHKVYPMLRLASDPDDTYQPYAMTNRELTDKIKTIVSEAITEAFSAHSAKWHDNANDCNVGFERTNDYRTSNMPTTGTASASVWYNIMTVREGNVSTSSSFGYGFQIAVQTTSNSTMGDTYVRAVNGGATPTWSEWKKLN